MREDMLAADFINNRVFDVTACKGFLISSYSLAIKEIYGDTIPMFQTADELKSLVDYYLAHPKERQKKAELAYQITLNRFERTKIVKEMLNIMETYRRQHMEAHHEK
jgi:spore maturation protein CgeB